MIWVSSSVKCFWCPHDPQQPKERYYCLRLFVEICGPRQARTRTGTGGATAGHHGLYSEGLPWYYKHAPVVPGTLEVIPPAPHLSPLALAHQMASLPRFPILSAPALLSPWPGSVSDAPLQHQKGCRQTSADLEDEGKRQSVTHLSSGCAPFLCLASLERCFMGRLTVARGLN
jgi:hypothetical protein